MSAITDTDRAGAHAVYKEIANASQKAPRRSGGEGERGQMILLVSLVGCSLTGKTMILAILISLCFEIDDCVEC